MRRSTIFGVFMSILIAGFAIIPAQAAEFNPEPKSKYEEALAKLDDFIADNQSYESQYPKEYDYLNSLAFKTSDLIDNYDDTDYTIRNAEAYGIAITAIDQAIESCRYIFGIVRAENLAKQAAQTSNATPTSATANTVATTQTPSAQTASTPTTLAVATTTEPKSDEQPKSTSNTITTFQATDPQDAADENLPVEIPKTGGISQSSSIIFIVIMSFIAAIAATGIYFIYNHQTKPVTPAARRKRR